MATIKDNLLIFIEKNFISKRQFYIKSGLSNGFLDKVSNIGSDKIEIILSAYPEINREWLMTGKGDMLNSDKEVVVKSGKNIPLIPIEAMAGVGNGDNTVLRSDCEYYQLPIFGNDVDFIIPIKGESMEPYCKSNDMVVCRMMPLDTFFQWGRIYVVDSNVGPMCKRVQQSSKPDHIKLTSDNKNYEPIDIHLKNIRALALVVGLIRLEE